MEWEASLRAKLIPDRVGNQGSHKQQRGHASAMYQLPKLPRGMNKSNSYLREHDHKGFHLLWNRKNVNSGHMIFTKISLDFCAYSHSIRESNCHVFDGSLQIQQFQGKPRHQHDLEQTSAIHSVIKRSSSDRKLEQGGKVCTFPHYKTKGHRSPVT